MYRGYGPQNHLYAQNIFGFLHVRSGKAMMDIDVKSRGPHIMAVMLGHHSCLFQYFDQCIMVPTLVKNFFV